MTTCTCETARDRAVEMVDARHGYTVEFSHSPDRHLDEYDEAEAAIVATCPVHRSP